MRLRAVVSARSGLPCRLGGGCWIRTNEGKSRQVYSLLPLATRETLQRIFTPRFVATEPVQAAFLQGSIRAGEGTRTPNRLFTKQVLYLLSYTSEIRRLLGG